MKNLKPLILAVCALSYSNLTYAMEVEEQPVINSVAAEPGVEPVMPEMIEVVQKHLKARWAHVDSKNKRTAQQAFIEQTGLTGNLVHDAANGECIELLNGLGEGARPDALLSAQAVELFLANNQFFRLGRTRMRELDGTVNALLAAASTKQESACRLLVKFQTELNRQILELLWLCKQLPASSGLGGNSTLHKLLKPHLVDYYRTLYVSVNSILRMTNAKGQRPCDLLPLDCLVPQDEFASIKGQMRHRRKQLAFYARATAEASGKAMDKLDKDHPRVVDATFRYALPAVVTGLGLAVCRYCEWNGIPYLKEFVFGAALTALDKALGNFSFF